MRTRIPVRQVVATLVAYAFFALASFALFQILALTLWSSRGCCVRLLTHAEIHTPALIYGYDVVLSSALPLFVLAVAEHRRRRTFAFRAAVAVGILSGIALGVGLAYIGYGPVARSLPWLAKGQNWFAKTAAVYLAAILVVLGLIWAAARTAPQERG